MEIYEFMQLDDADKLDAFSKGVALGTCIDEDGEWEAVQINDFYVEWQVGDDSPSKVKTHRSPNLIMKYLDDEPLDLNYLL